MKKNHFILLVLSIPVLAPILLVPAWWFGQSMEESFFAYELVNWLAMAGIILGIGSLYAAIPYAIVAILLYRAGKKYSLGTLQKVSWIIPFAIAIPVGVFFAITVDQVRAIIFVLCTLGIGYAYVALANILYLVLKKTNKLNPVL